MSRVTKIEYICDGCEQPKQPSELRRFTLTESTIGEGKLVATAKTDLCAACERRLQAVALADWFPRDEAEKLYGAVR